jgi:hypothetical protein
MGGVRDFHGCKVENRPESLDFRLLLLAPVDEFGVNSEFSVKTEI